MNYCFLSSILLHWRNFLLKVGEDKDLFILTGMSSTTKVLRNEKKKKSLLIVLGFTAKLVRSLCARVMILRIDIDADNL